jgi:SAM-dependent methyltransferase
MRFLFWLNRFHVRRKTVVLMSQYAIDYPRYVWQVLNGSRMNHERQLAELRQRDIATLIDTNRSLRVLDLANGRLRPQYTILKAAGHQVYGIDLANQPTSTRVNIYYRLARRIFNRTLDIPAKALADQTLICGNVGVLPFPDSSFDLVTSIAAFEHFLNAPAVLAELARVVRPGGLVWVCVHLFTSPSGGHNLSFAEIPLRKVPPGVDAWDHLRRRRLPFHVPLNEWRKNQYLAEFARHFEIVKNYCAFPEGEGLLTPEIEAELSAYSRDELTCGAYVILARKPVN